LNLSGVSSAGIKAREVGSFASDANLQWARAFILGITSSIMGFIAIATSTGIIGEEGKSFDGG